MTDTTRALLKQQLQTWGIFTAIWAAFFVGIALVGGASTGSTLFTMSISWLVLSAIWWLLFYLSLHKRFGL